MLLYLMPQKIIKWTCTFRRRLYLIGSLMARLIYSWKSSDALDTETNERRHLPFFFSPLKKWSSNRSPHILYITNDIFMLGTDVFPLTRLVGLLLYVLKRLFTCCPIQSAEWKPPAPLNVSCLLPSIRGQEPIAATEKTLKAFSSNSLSSLENGGEVVWCRGYKNISPLIKRIIVLFDVAVVKLNSHLI